MQVVGFNTLDSMSTYNYIYNRLNFKFFPTKTITGALEVRNRIYYGQTVQNTPGFGKSLNTDNGYVNLSELLVNDSAVVVHTMIDRVWADWAYKKWEVRIGRQRINWGKTLVWNPNDLFNTYNYTDFDYEERPGSDAVRLTYYPTGMSAIEAAVKPGKHKDETVAAGDWRFNKAGYDFQVLGGLYYTDLAFGTGWSGSIGNAGFKGEATWFQPKNKLTDTSGVISATVSADYSFKNALYIHGAVLYNNHPVKYTNLLALQQTFGETLSAKNLMPSDWSFFAEVSKDITPLLHADLSFIYGTSPDFLYTMPSVTYSISDNWDITLVEEGILLFSGNNGYKPFNSIFIRLKWSF